MPVLNATVVGMQVYVSFLHGSKHTLTAIQSLRGLSPQSGLILSIFFSITLISTIDSKLRNCSLGCLCFYWGGHSTMVAALKPTA